jgi:hypothetical protein
VKQLSIEYEIRVSYGVMGEQGGHWERRTVLLLGPANPFEALAMAAGLRAEDKNIRNVQVLQTSQVTRTIG